jgi:hypothetical protein
MSAVIVPGSAYPVMSFSSLRVDLSGIETLYDMFWKERATGVKGIEALIDTMTSAAGWSTFTPATP